MFSRLLHKNCSDIRLLLVVLTKNTQAKKKGPFGPSQSLFNRLFILDLLSIFYLYRLGAELLPY